MVHLPVRELVEHTFAMPLTHADAMRRSRGVQASATAIKFGCKKSPAHFLTAYGWDAGGQGDLCFQCLAVACSFTAG